MKVSLTKPQNLQEQPQHLIDPLKEPQFEYPPKDPGKRTIGFHRHYAIGKHIGVHPHGFRYVLGYSPINVKYVPVIKPYTVLKPLLHHQHVRPYWKHIPVSTQHYYPPVMPVARPLPHVLDQGWKPIMPAIKPVVPVIEPTRHIAPELHNYYYFQTPIAKPALLPQPPLYHVARPQLPVLPLGATFPAPVLPAPPVQNVPVHPVGHPVVAQDQPFVPQTHYDNPHIHPVPIQPQPVLPQPLPLQPVPFHPLQPVPVQPHPLQPVPVQPQPFVPHAHYPEHPLEHGVQSHPHIHHPVYFQPAPVHPPVHHLRPEVPTLHGGPFAIPAHDPPYHAHDPSYHAHVDNTLLPPHVDYTPDTSSVTVSHPPIFVQNSPVKPSDQLPPVSVEFHGNPNFFKQNQHPQYGAPHDVIVGRQPHALPFPSNDNPHITHLHPVGPVENPEQAFNPNAAIQPGLTDLQFPIHLPDHPHFRQINLRPTINLQPPFHHFSNNANGLRPSISLEPPYNRRHSNIKSG